MLTGYSTKLQVQFIKQGKQVVAYSPALDISTCGKTTAQARQRFQELARIFIKEIVNAGTAEDVLSELGWVKHAKQKNWVPPAVASSNVGIRMPVTV
ncbi:hypothetical protein A3F27_03160 [Candidatus Kaiserbacteria bacterium RIFCSPHIGHO2_12_FULL_53_13]|uniref:HicB-like antitoxin of toxin-antitoxin system domain-containing protein n=1 Tax=Candidatus Kaiserbacteria bacterium RIFCSPHIGHO2_12_FULL_53_13 TaxID=1798502 RepID=A0A1F6E8B0_9BACT|nr:MAG: hypothetical protein A3F27_03160 [Candidatus Kaiserbacteria bacterium RIFCSPHIGHO2_12_FULL_53_13]OGG74252.1 MAG: hypothetical protein A3A37_01110 [Candidatus Kaiserbacteria bacterium RIFCSPLOWO2_01_FULL_52_36]